MAHDRRWWLCGTGLARPGSLHALACATARKPTLKSGGRSRHVEPRCRTEGGMPLAGAVPFCRAYGDHSQRGMGRARGTLACCTSFRETAGVVVRSLCHAKAGYTKWRPQLARRITVWCRMREASRRCSALSWCTGHGPIATSAAQRARAARSRAAPLPERQSAQTRSRLPRGSWLRIGGRSWHVAPRPGADGGGAPVSAVSFRVARTDRNQRATAHACIRLACCASSRETASAEARSRLPRESWLRKVEATAGTSHHGLVPKEGGFPTAHCPFVVYRSIATSATRRARAARSRAAPPAERQPAQRRARACNANAGCGLEAAAGTSHHGVATEEECLPPVQHPFI